MLLPAGLTYFLIGLIRDATARWICSFLKKVSSTTAYVADLWGLYEGLKIPLMKGMKSVVVQVDSQAVLVAKSLTGMQ